MRQSKHLIQYFMSVHLLVYQRRVTISFLFVPSFPQNPSNTEFSDWLLWKCTKIWKQKYLKLQPFGTQTPLSIAQHRKSLFWKRTFSFLENHNKKDKESRFISFIFPLFFLNFLGNQTVHKENFDKALFLFFKKVILSLPSITDHTKQNAQFIKTFFPIPIF